ncbi:carbonic anhydrase, chloroplastic [Hordeum vulgare]|nr:carbonic anhydrase, chloroplastic [Hordeum vulgare]
MMLAPFLFEVEVIVVIVHNHCGGIKALLSLKDGVDDSFHFVEDWIRIGFPAKKKVHTECASMPFDDRRRPNLCRQQCAMTAAPRARAARVEYRDSMPGSMTRCSRSSTRRR